MKVPDRTLPVAVALYRFAMRRLHRDAPHGAICALVHEGQVLFVRHTYPPLDLFQLPGGRGKAGERPCETIHRELMEELQVNPEHLIDLGDMFVKGRGGPTRLHLFAAQVPDRQIVPCRREIASFGWYSLPKPPSNIVPGAREALRRYNRLASRASKL